MSIFHRNECSFASNTVSRFNIAPLPLALCCMSSSFPRSICCHLSKLSCPIKPRKDPPKNINTRRLSCEAAKSWNVLVCHRQWLNMTRQTEANECDHDDNGNGKIKQVSEVQTGTQESRQKYWVFFANATYPCWLSRVGFRHAFAPPWWGSNWGAVWLNSARFKNAMKKLIGPTWFDSRRPEALPKKSHASTRQLLSALCSQLVLLPPSGKKKFRV